MSRLAFSFAREKQAGGRLTSACRCASDKPGIQWHGLAGTAAYLENSKRCWRMSETAVSQALAS